MPFERKRPCIILNPEETSYLQELSRLRTREAQAVERAKMVLLYAEGISVSAIARQLQTNRPKIERCIDKALQLRAIAPFKICREEESLLL